MLKLWLLFLIFILSYADFNPMWTGSNSASDAQQFSSLQNRQLITSSKKALSSGRYNAGNIASLFKRGSIGINSYETSVTNQFIMMSKKYSKDLDTGFRDLSDEEISRRARDKSLRPEERKKYQKEEKNRGLRNKQKRDNYKKNNGKKSRTK